jgi:hypothetical protein
VRNRFPRKTYESRFSDKKLIFFDFRFNTSTPDPKSGEGKHFHASGMRAIVFPHKNGANDAFPVKIRKKFSDPDPCHLRSLLETSTEIPIFSALANYTTCNINVYKKYCGAIGGYIGCNLVEVGALVGAPYCADQLPTCSKNFEAHKPFGMIHFI